MRFTKIILFAAFLMCLATAARAQSTCTLTVDKAPELRGFKLGMPLSEIKAFAPDIKVNDQGFGASNAVLDDLNRRDAVRFKGVNTIFLHFVDESLTSFTVRYNDSISWEDASQFVAKVSESLRLPAAWEGDDIQKRMNCNGFRISAMPNSIGLEETNAENVVRHRRAEEAERKRRSFTP
jgi:hypothetical protein